MSNGRELVGTYVPIVLGGEQVRVFCERAGDGIPLLCLHTAGADARQWHHVMTDPALDEFEAIGFDLPGHGRTLPLGAWWTRQYRLTRGGYRVVVYAVADALGLERPAVMGSSMGGAMVLDLVVRDPGRFRAGIGIGAPLSVSGRRTPYLHHPACDSSEVAAGYTMALNAPTSPAFRTHENWWIYSQGSPGVYDGDLHFYTDDWDGRDLQLAPAGSRSPLHMLCGEYDYSCTPEMAREAAEVLEADSFTVMDGIGHFPMIENPPRFLTHLSPLLARIRAAEAVQHPAASAVTEPERHHDTAGRRGGDSDGNPEVR